MSSKIKPEVWAETMETFGLQLSNLLETHREAMAVATTSSPVSKLKIAITGKIDLSHKAPNMDLSISFEPVVVKQRDKKSIQGDDPDQMKLPLAGAPGVVETKKPEAPKTESVKTEPPKPEPPKKTSEKKEPKSKPAKAEKKPEPAKKTEAPKKPEPPSKKDDDEEDIWGKGGRRN